MKHMLFLIVLSFFFFSAVTVRAETIYLSIAASMTDAFKEIIADFSASHSGGKILPNFASSGSLAKQIDQGAPADIYVSANPKWMDFLMAKQLIASKTKKIFAFNKLVFIGQRKKESLSLLDVANLRQIAIGSPDSVPAGQYARQAMESAGIYTRLQQENKLVMAKDVRQALIYADRGEVDGAFVYRTDALLARSAAILLTVPDNLYSRVSYPLALTIAGKEKALARAFYAYMSTPKAVATLTKYGFEPVH